MVETYLSKPLAHMVLLKSWYRCVIFIYFIFMYFRAFQTNFSEKKSGVRHYSKYDFCNIWSIVIKKILRAICRSTFFSILLNPSVVLCGEIYPYKDWLCQRQLLQVFYRKGVLKNFANFIRKHLGRTLFSHKVAGWVLEVYKFIQKSLQ